MRIRKVGALGATLIVSAGLAIAQSTEDRVAELERKIDALSQELETRQFGNVVRRVGESHHGLGAAASKVYDAEQGLSIGGYGELLYQRFDDDSKTDSADALRAILYVGYKYDDRWVLNTEIEIEHADEAFLEFAYLDYLHRDELNFRAGLLLIPMGHVNELHEPNVFLGARRPDIESRIIPTTWRENGMGLFGDLGWVDYKAYLVNGLKASGFSDSGLRSGRQKGSKALADDFAGVLRIDVHPTPGLVLGGSLYHGKSGQDLGVAVGTRIAEAHADLRTGGLHLRGLVVKAKLDDVAALNRINAGPGVADPDIASIGETLSGYYLEAGYDVLSGMASGEHALIPFVRYEAYDTQDAVPAGFSASGANDVEVVTVGVNYKPRDEIVFKADRQFYDTADGSGKDQYNVAVGYVF